MLHTRCKLCARSRSAAKASSRSCDPQNPSDAEYLRFISADVLHPLRCLSRLGVFEVGYQPLNVGGSVDQLQPNLTWINVDEVGRRGVNVEPLRATQHQVLGLACVAMLAVLVACRRSDAPGPVNTPESPKTSAKASAELISPSNSVLDPFDREVRAYIEQTKPLRQEAAQPAEAVPRQATSPASAEAGVRARQTALAALIRTKARPTPHQGDIFSSASADVFRQRLSAAFASQDA